MADCISGQRRKWVKERKEERERYKRSKGRDIKKEENKETKGNLILTGSGHGEAGWQIMLD